MIQIAHLYPYECNLYGENGNIKALTYMLEEKKIKYQVTEIHKEDEIDFLKYDFLFIGSARACFLDQVRERLIPKKEEILKYIELGKVMLICGNAIQIFEFLDLYETKYYEQRIVSNVVGTTHLCKGIIKGFQNTEYLIDSNNHLLFLLDNGYGNNKTMLEGYQKNNFYATSIIGPLLARNKNLCSYMIEQIVENKTN